MCLHLGAQNVSNLHAHIALPPLYRPFVCLQTFSSKVNAIAIIVCVLFLSFSLSQSQQIGVYGRRIHSQWSHDEFYCGQETIEKQSTELYRIEHFQYLRINECSSLI